ncbi:Caleosin related protein-domain-containing protein [Phascolomyces articulosus]|uniref:Caleosin related protein-domain-containing protein n=1 Tax=Phascolomyces articulosus TaxID=60185 RepID=A0AAD5K0B4_9FUNG|nr:Caleosin related protein-domain-containing protein [Phascolomyces articulosus]
MAIIGVADPGSSSSSSSSRQQRSTVTRRRIVNVSNQETNAVRKHQKFWDRKNKGYITPIDTATGLMNLGYGMVFSLTIGTFMGVLLAYATQDSWIPDPRCRINVRKLSRPTKRPSQSRVYDEYGHFDTEKFEMLFDKYAQSDLSGNTITLTELLQFASEQGSYGASPTAWSIAMFNWIGLYMMIGQHGSFHKQDIQAVYDGSLFYRIREARRAHVQPASLDSSTGHLVLPQNAIRVFERHLNTAVEHLPQSTMAIVRSWVPPVDSMLGGNVVSTPTPRRSSRGFNSLAAATNTQERKHISGTKSVSFDSQSFSLTGVRGYEPVSSSSSSSIASDDEDMMPDLISEETDSTTTSLGDISIGVFTSGLCPEGADYYRDTPYTNWIGGQLSGVQKSHDAYGGRHDIPMAESDNKKYHHAPLSGVKNDGHVFTPLIDWLVEDQKGEETKKSHSYMDQLESITLTGVKQSSATPTEHRIVDDSENVLSSHDENKKVRFHLQSVTLSGVRYHNEKDDTPMRGISIVDAPSPIEKDLNFDLELVSLSGLQPVATAEKKQDNNGLTIVQAPTSFEFQEIDFETYKQPVALTGLSAQKVSDDQRGAPLAGVEAPSSLLYKYEKSINVHVEPVVLTGVSKMSSTASDEMISNKLPMVEAPVSFESPKDNVVFKSMAVTLTGVPSISDETPVLSTSTTATSSPLASLSGLRSENTEFASFVEAPTSFEVKKPVALETITLSGLRLDDTLTAVGFVEAPAFYEPKEPVALERPSLAGIREQDQVFDVGFVEVPDEFVVEKSYEIEPVSLSGLSRDTTTASFVEEPSIEKQPVDLAEISKPVPLSGLSTSIENAYSRIVEAPLDYKDIQVIGLEPAALFGLREEAASVWGVEEPAGYKGKESVALEPVSLHGLVRKENKRWLTDDAGSTTSSSYYRKGRRPSLEEPLDDSDVDLLFDWRKDTDFAITKVDLDFVWKWRERAGFDATLPPIENVPLCGVVSSDMEQAFIEDFPIVKDPWPSKKARIEIPFEATPISVMGMSWDEPKEKLKNHLNIGSLPGVITLQERSLYEDPVTLPEPIKEQVDLEQYRHAFPLSGIHEKDLQERTIKNWLNNGTLPGTLVKDAIYEAPSETIPEDYIEPRPKDDHDHVGVLAAGISNKKIKKPLKNWLNVKSTGDMYEPAKPELEPKKVEIDLELYRAPFPLNGLTDDEIKHKNWLNNSTLPGVQADSKSSYQEAAEDIPSDYIQPRDPSLDDENKPLNGIDMTTDRKVRLKNWLSTSDLPGVQAQHEHRVYDDANELSPSEYIQPPLDDQELPADFKLTGVSATTDVASEISVPELSSRKTVQHDSEDEHSIATESTSPGPLSPEEYKGKRPISVQKVAMANSNWNIMTDITNAKEE